MDNAFYAKLMEFKEVIQGFISNAGGWATTGTTTLTGDVTIDQDGNELSFTENVNIPTINGVKVYRALLTQSGTDAPVATVLENSLGGVPVWSYIGAGQYNGTLTGAFTADKTALSISNTVTPKNTYVYRNNADEIIVTVFNSVDEEYVDAGLTKTFIEILVYP